MNLSKNFPAKETLDEKNLKIIIRQAIHEIGNSLQVIKLRTDLELQHHADIFYPAIKRIDRSLGDLCDYFLLIEPTFCAERADEVLDEVIDKLKNEPPHRNVKLQLIYEKPLPFIRIDPRQFRKALKGVIRFCRFLIKDGGELKIDVCLKDTQGQKQLNLIIDSCSAAPFQVQETDVFQLCLPVRNYRVGLRMAIAHRILQRHAGGMVFHKRSPNQANVTIFLPVMRNESREDEIV